MIAQIFIQKQSLKMEKAKDRGTYRIDIADCSLGAEEDKKRSGLAHDESAPTLLYKM